MPTALLSVYHKEGIVEFARALVEMGWELLASGGTAKALRGADLPVKDVAELVGGGAILGHRVVTLSREIHAGLLATDSDEDQAELNRLGIPRIDLVCVDLYPLEEEIKRPGSTPESVIEKTDIGGPTMLSAAAKGRRIVVCDPADRQVVIAWLRAGIMDDKEGFVTALAAKADFVVANYRLFSARYHSDGAYDGVLGTVHVDCRYGENAYQAPAALFMCGESSDPLALDKFMAIGDTADPSYNNLCDLDRLLQTMTHAAAAFHVNRGKVPYITLGCKHGNMCGAAFGEDPKQVIQGMVSGDPLAIFGGLVMTNFPVDDQDASLMVNHAMEGRQRRILDGVVATDFSDEALNVLGRKQGKCRFLVNPALANLDWDSLDTTPRFRPVRGGFLRQPNYTYVLDIRSDDLQWWGPDTVRLQQDDLLLAWAVGATSNSNTITLVKNNQLIGNGTGQQDRVSCCTLAVGKAKRAGHDTRGCVAYSDSFFPFVDGPEVLADAGVSVILTSAGSVKDQEVRDFCLTRGVSLWMVPDRRARGFFGH